MSTSPGGNASSAAQGVTFPAPTSASSDDKSGERPTTPTVKGLVADAVRKVDGSLSSSIDASKNWRDSYLAAVRDMTMKSAESGEDAITMARDGLAGAYSRMVFDDGSSETTLAEWDMAAAVAAARGQLSTRTVTGTQSPQTELTIPLDGKDLRGDDLLRQLDTWVEKGIIEPSSRDAVKEVAAHPEWLSLPGHVLASVGAGAEMGPLEMLLQWGATVLAVDIPKATDRLVKFAEAGAGTMKLPVDGDEAGVNIVSDPAAVAAWIDHEAGASDIVFGMHAYADSGMHVRVTLAADLISQYLYEKRTTTALAYLATPTDAFVVPPEVVSEARHRWQNRGTSKYVQGALNKASRGLLFQEPYPHNSTVADCLVAQQGPNYAIAKRLQRWRAVAAEADGRRVSFNVAPATLTRSVTKNPVLRACYGGAHHFGVEVFDPATSRALMAALLVYDIMREDAAEVPGKRKHPEELFSDDAAHGGLWRVAWSPRSALGVAAVFGAPKLLKR